MDPYLIEPIDVRLDCVEYGDLLAVRDRHDDVRAVGKVIEHGFGPRRRKSVHDLHRCTDRSTTLASSWVEATGKNAARADLRPYRSGRLAPIEVAGGPRDA